jgi:predicted esterase
MLCPVIAAGDAGKPADLMSGVWHGTLTAGGTACQMFIRVQGSGQAFGGQGIVWHGLTEDQAQAAARGQKPQAEVPGWLCVVQQFAIKLDGDTATFQGTAVQSLFGGTKYRPDVFVGKLTPPGVIAGNASDAKKSEGLFRLYKEGALAKPLPLDVAKEKAAQLGCVDGGKYHYTVYVPKSYTPEKATPLLINFNPGGNGQPLSTKMAEETGWIMAGLTESQNGPTEPISENRDAALFDLRRRFNIDMKHVYFSGLSGGARASAASGQAYPGICAGLILIGAAYAQGAPPKDQAIFYLTGQTDMNKGEVSGAYEKAKSAGRKCQLVVHPGGHDWGRAEDHEAAIRWLAQETLGAKAPDKKKP